MVGYRQEEKIINRENHLIRKCFPKKECCLRKALPLTTISNLEMIPKGQVQYLYPMVLNIFANSEMRNLLLAGRLQHFLKSWEVVASNSEILKCLSSLKIDFNWYFMFKSPWGSTSFFAGEISVTTTNRNDERQSLLPICNISWSGYYIGVTRVGISNFETKWESQVLLHLLKY